MGDFDSKCVSSDSDFGYTFLIFFSTKRSGWWFQIFFIFTPIWGRFPFWLIFLGWVVQPPTRKDLSDSFPFPLSWSLIFGFFCDFFPVGLMILLLFFCRQSFFLGKGIDGKICVSEKNQTSRNQFCRPDVKFLETSYKEKIPVCYVKAQRGGACGVPFDKRTRRRERDFFGSDTW